MNLELMLAEVLGAVAKLQSEAVDLRDLEQRVQDLEAAESRRVACSGCHHLFADNDGYQQHHCAGAQGR